MNKSGFDGVEIRGLKLARDEARLHAHLFTAEMKTQHEKLEAEWRVLKRNLKGEMPRLKKSIESVNQAMKPVIGDLRAAYIRLKDQVRGIES